MIFLVMKAIIVSATIVIFLVLTVSCVAGTTASKAEGSHTSPAAARLPAGLSYEELALLLEDQTANVLLLDVRTQAEFDQGHLPGAVLSPYDALEAAFGEPDKSRPIVVYCRSGNRSSIAARTLARMGYTNVSDFGAIGRWRGSLSR
jgi:rhodanese-related sulfurtransferase